MRTMPAASASSLCPGRPPVLRVLAEASLHGVRQKPVTSPELETHELRELIDGGVRDPAPLAGRPTATTLRPGRNERRLPIAQPWSRLPRRTSARRTRPSRRSGASRRRASTRASGVRPPRDVCRGESGKEDAPRPLLILAHHDVLRERVLLPRAPRDRRVDVREQRDLEAERPRPCSSR